ncbi:oligosaccharide flippase family protein [Marinobacter sp. CA1]|uniref:oligosaccharide flippase family protein n=1 Tax=Marinobacter sp. CA1 TaxID=2817656 RepID=UPI001D06EB65|nr:oligosaccharide flippase family protein [Marinobacter sp. CA1]UDL07036.1 oligosaccharide flippase family protein [Marinobacter sp. CA1]
MIRHSASAMNGAQAVIGRALEITRSNRFLQNVGWLSLGMLATRVIRLGITIMVARNFAPDAFGQIALIFTVHEIVSFLLQRCTTVKLIQAPARELPDFCRSIYLLNWLLGWGLFAAQCFAGFIVSHIYEQPELWFPISVLGLSHLIMPMAMVQCALNIRAGKLGIVARIDVLQTFFELGVIAALLALGFKIWALVIPKTLVSMVWVLGHRYARKWNYKKTGRTAAWRPILRYSSGLLLIDALQVVRQNADYLVIGYVLGIEALGLYFFAFNAGLGIATSFAGAMNSALLPHLCQNRHSSDAVKHRFLSSLKIVALLVGGLVLVQASSAFLYVPIVFGQDWADRGSVPLIAILCLAALPKSLFDSGSQYLRALDRPIQDIWAHITLTVTLLATVLAGVSHGLMGVAVGVLGAYLVGAVVMARYCLRPPRQTR